MTTETPCPVCGGEMEDTRHVMVECFYAVDEVVPTAKKVPFLVEVDPDITYWGTTRRYGDGTMDRFVTTALPPTIITNEDGSTTEFENAKIDVVQDPIPGTRVLEKTGFSVTCCKRCRADFLRLMRDWCDGLHVQGRGDGAIPFRENGATRFVSEEEYQRHRHEPPPRA